MPGLKDLPKTEFGSTFAVVAKDLDGSIAPTVVKVNAAYQVGKNDGFVIADTGIAFGSFTVTLPPAAQIAPFSRMVRIMKLAPRNVLTILPGAGDSIFGAVTSATLYNAFSTIELVSDGVHNWYSFPTMFMPACMSTNTVTGTYTVLDADYKILADATGGAFQISLPSIGAFAEGHEFRFEKVDVSGNAVTIAAFSGDTIEGAATVSLSSQYATLRVTGNGVTPNGIWYKV